MSLPTLILTPKKVRCPYDAERYALRAADVDIGDLVYVDDTGKWWLVVDVTHLNSDAGYDNIHTDSVAESFTHVDITGTLGNGYITLPSQAVAPAAPAAGNIRIYSDSANKFAWIGASGYTRNFDGTLTAGRTYTLPDASGTVAISGQIFPAANGTTIAPAFTFLADLTAGMLYAGSGGVKIATSALQAVLFSGVDQSAAFSAQIKGVNGTAGAPSFTFTNDPDSGFYSSAGNQIGVTTNGTLSLRFDTAGTIYGASLNNSLQLIGSGGIGLTAAGTNQSITLTPSGTGMVLIGTGANGYSFADAQGYGMFYGGGTQIAFKTAFGVNTTLTGAHMLLGGLTTDGTGVLQFPTGASDNTSGITFGSGQTFFYNSSTGVINISAGTNSATALYVINSAAQGASEIRLSNTGASGKYGQILFGGNTNTNANAMVFTTNSGTTALTLDSSATTTTVGRIKAVAIKTTTYTVTTSDHVIVGNHATTPFTITMIAASTNTGREFVIKNKGAAVVTVSATGLGQIDGANTATLNQYQALHLISDGATWNIV